jgi:hypothetical protein
MGNDALPKHMEIIKGRRSIRNGATSVSLCTTMPFKAYSSFINIIEI